MSRTVLPAVHAVMVLLENIQETGIPTVEQVEAAILGDREMRKLDETFTKDELIDLESGGGFAMSKAEEIFRLAEFYRVALIQQRQEMHRQYDRWSAEVNELAMHAADLQKRVLELEMIRDQVAWQNAEAKLEEGQQQRPKSG